MQIQVIGISACFLAALVPSWPTSAQAPASVECLADPTEVREVDRLPVVLEGYVYDPDGSAAEGVVVSSAAGGKAVADARGWYHLETPVPLDAESVQVTAVGATGRNLLASTSVDLRPLVLGQGGSTTRAPVDPLLFSQGASCFPAWLPTFGRPWGTNSFVQAAGVYDDGDGPVLYVGGSFTHAGGFPANSIARWDGTSWSPVGNGQSGTVLALTEYDDGSGPALYAGGSLLERGPGEMGWIDLVLPPRRAIPRPRPRPGGVRRRERAGALRRRQLQWSGKPVGEIDRELGRNELVGARHRSSTPEASPGPSRSGTDRAGHPSTAG